MEIDTLIFSGASTKGVIFLGCLNYLMENNILKKCIVYRLVIYLY